MQASDYKDLMMKNRTNSYNMEVIKYNQILSYSPLNVDRKLSKQSNTVQADALTDSSFWTKYISKPHPQDGLDGVKTLKPLLLTPNTHVLGLELGVHFLETAHKLLGEQMWEIEGEYSDFILLFLFTSKQQTNSTQSPNLYGKWGI